MGPWPGGQAELLRVPWGDFNCLRLGEDAEERQTDYVMLADIFPTGYHATDMAHVRPGDQTVIYGAGPVGAMAAYSAIIKGASKVMVVDRHPDRLAKIEEIGAIPIDDSSVTLSRLVRSVRFTGSLGVVGVYVPQDPGGPDELAQQGVIPFDYGQFWFRGQAMGTGQCPVKKYDRALRDLIAGGKAKPSWIVSHELPLE
jgi:glutathione-independent formaldehyde dehydrogenase